MGLNAKLSDKRGFMKLKRILVFFVLITMNPFTTTRSQALSLTVLGGESFSGGSVSPNDSFTTGFTPVLGGGILLGSWMFPSVAFELGTLYMPRGLTQTHSVSSQVDTTRFNTIQIPALCRVSILPAISVGVGGFYSYVLGNLVSSYFSASSLSKTDYGLVGSVSLKLDLLPLTSFVIDGRYLSGLTNVSLIPGTTVYLKDFQVLAGIRFGN